MMIKHDFIIKNEKKLNDKQPHIHVSNKKRIICPMYAKNITTYLISPASGWVLLLTFFNIFI